MSVVGFQTIVVTHDDQVAVTAPVVLRDADPAVESRINGIARFNRNIDSLMSPAMADAVFGADAALVGIMIALERIHQIDRKRCRHLRQRIFLVREQRARVPVFGVDRTVLDKLSVADVFPRIVVVNDDFHRFVDRLQRVQGDDSVHVGDGFHGIGKQRGFLCGQGVPPLFEQVELPLQRFDLLAELFGIRCRLQVFTGVRGRLRMAVLCRCRRGEQQQGGSDDMSVFHFVSLFLIDS